METSVHPCQNHAPEREREFSRIIALGWYDGPTEGVAQCGTCGASYRFQMVDEDSDWAEGEDVRIFKLAPLPADAVDRIVSALREHEEPRWPMWVPSWRFDSPAAAQVADGAVSAVLAQAGRPERLIASSDGLRTVLASTPLGTDEMDSAADWFGLLGLRRRGSTASA
jgi:hypothetical protein